MDIVLPIFNNLSDRVRNSFTGKAYAKKMALIGKVHIGSIAPDFVQPDVNGKAVSLHDFGGKYVLVDFWASWCGPCRAENPNLKKAYRSASKSVRQPIFDYLCKFWKPYLKNKKQIAFRTGPKSPTLFDALKNMRFFLQMDTVGELVLGNCLR